VNLLRVVHPVAVGGASYIETKERMVTLGYDRCNNREVTGNSDAGARVRLLSHPNDRALQRLQ
jgi:hypothetical protein